MISLDDLVRLLALFLGSALPVSPAQSPKGQPLNPLLAGSHPPCLSRYCSFLIAVRLPNDHPLALSPLFSLLRTNPQPPTTPSLPHIHTFFLFLLLFVSGTDFLAPLHLQQQAAEAEAIRLREAEERREAEQRRKEEELRKHQKLQDALRNLGAKRKALEEQQRQLDTKKV